MYYSRLEISILIAYLLKKSCRNNESNSIITFPLIGIRIPYFVSKKNYRHFIIPSSITVLIIIRYSLIVFIKHRKHPLLLLQFDKLLCTHYYYCIIGETYIVVTRFTNACIHSLAFIVLTFIVLIT